LESSPTGCAWSDDTTKKFMSSFEQTLATRGLIGGFLETAQPVPITFTTHRDGATELVFAEARATGTLVHMEHTARHTNGGWVAAQLGTLVVAVDYTEIHPVALVFLTGCDDPLEHMVMGPASGVAHVHPHASAECKRRSPTYPPQSARSATKQHAEENRSVGHHTYLILPHQLHVLPFYVNAVTTPELYAGCETHTVSSGDHQCLITVPDHTHGKQKNNPYIGSRYNFTGAIVLAPCDDRTWIPHLSYLPRLLWWDHLRRQAYRAGAGAVVIDSHQDRVARATSDDAAVRLEVARTVRLAALVCAGCGKPATKKCARCRTPYCTQACQRAHWEPAHRAACPAVKATRGY
jgi:hypothetical protein